mmetsp:Transcript_93969/g.270744  ORF Transcript_93969/g.270744 Transcript_93969/m.270744 type:complete len:227 (+) Transcript_93969:1090-1770(+)
MDQKSTWMEWKSPETMIHSSLNKFRRRTRRMSRNNLTTRRTASSAKPRASFKNKDSNWSRAEMVKQNKSIIAHASLQMALRLRPFNKRTTNSKRKATKKPASTSRHNKASGSMEPLVCMPIMMPLASTSMPKKMSNANHVRIVTCSFNSSRNKKYSFWSTYTPNFASSSTISSAVPVFMFWRWRLMYMSTFSSSVARSAPWACNVLMSSRSSSKAPSCSEASSSNS